MSFNDASSFILGLSTMKASRTTSSTTSATSSSTTTDTASLDLGALTSVFTSFDLSSLTATASSSSSATAQANSKSSHGLSSGAKIGIGVGIGAGSLLAIGAVGALLVIRRRKRNAISSGGSTTSSSHGSSPKDATLDDPEGSVAVATESVSPVTATSSTARAAAFPTIPLPANMSEADGGIIPELADPAPAAVELPAQVQDSNTELDTAGAPIEARDRAEVPNADTRYELAA